MKYVTVRKTLVKISILAIILMALGLIAIHFMILDKKYVYTFVYINIIIQTLVIAVYILTRFNRPKDVKIIRHQFENKFIKGDTNIFPEHIFSTNPRNAAIFKIYIGVSEFAKDDPPEIYIDIKGRHEQAISDIKNHLRNIKVGIEKDMFLIKGDIIVMPNEKINFKFRKDVNVKIFILEEVYTL